MKRHVCRCLAESVLCEACGTPCRWFQLADGRKFRFHLAGHSADPDGSARAVFRPHVPSTCYGARVAAMLRLRARGQLSEDSPR